jgi:hypothetical protein
VDSSVVGYDGGRNVRDEERSVGRKALSRKPEPKRRIAWPRWSGFRGMTLRSWLDLLVVPLVLVGIGLLFEMQQDLRQQAAVAHQQDLAEQRAQDEALQAYLDEVGRLMLENNLRDPKVQTILRARTITVLGRLDPSWGRMPPSGKTALMQFLVEADLVQGVDPIISLRGADLREAYLYDAADNLSGAVLRNADLSDAHLTDANLTNANLHRVDLSHADLSDAHLTAAHLIDANLTNATLEGADLSITMEELDQQALSLEGATMPNGQKYEDWLKDREKRQQDE